MKLFPETESSSYAALKLAGMATEFEEGVMTFGQDWTRRDFLQTGSIVVPTLKRMLAGNAATTVGQDEMGGPPDPGKFAPVELSSHFNASPSDFGPRERAKAMGGPSQHDGRIHTPSGKQNFRGIPFLLGSEGSQAKSWIVLSRTAETVEIVVDQKAGSICLAQFCDWDAERDSDRGARCLRTSWPAPG